MILENNIYKKLYDKINKTSRMRFYAQSRLNRHNQLSLWFIIIFSLVIILFSLISIYSFNINIETINNKLKYKEDFIELSLIFFSIFILTISTALTMSNFGVRAEKFHDCGKELSSLAIKLNEIVNDTERQNPDQYKEYSDKYELILSKYDNHKPIDYKTYIIFYYYDNQQKVRVDTDSKKECNLINFEYFSLFVKYHLSNIVEYLVYWILGIILVVWLFFIFEDKQNINFNNPTTLIEKEFKNDNTTKPTT